MKTDNECKHVVQFVRVHAIVEYQSTGNKIDQESIDITDINAVHEKVCLECDANLLEDEA